MKKLLLLGAILALGTQAFGAKTISIIEGGVATSQLSVKVEGEVFDPAAQSLVVEVLTAASKEGEGFTFVMPSLLKDSTAVEASTGTFKAQILTNEVPEAFTTPPAVSLIKDGTKTPANGTSVEGAPSGTANDVTITYNLTGSLDTAEVNYNGSLTVQAMAGEILGTYADTSVGLVVEVTGQDAPPAPTK